MTANGQIIERLFLEIARLEPEGRLRLIARVIGTMAQPEKPKRNQPLVYGKYRASGRRMSTEEDFTIAEWHPTESVPTQTTPGVENSGLRP